VVVGDQNTDCHLPLVLRLPAEISSAKDLNCKSDSCPMPAFAPRSLMEM
jgi:hypothetical protein